MITGGRITAVDIYETARDLFPAHLEGVLTPIAADGLKWLESQPDESIDFIFEDSSHGEDMCRAVAELAKRKLTPGGLLVMHDAAHDRAKLGDGSMIPSQVGAEVRRGLDRSIPGQYDIYLTEPSDCGLAIFRRPFGKLAAMLDDGYSYAGLNELEAQANEKATTFEGSGFGQRYAGVITPDDEASMQPNPLPEGWHIAENTKPRPGDPEGYITNDQPMEVREVEWNAVSLPVDNGETEALENEIIEAEAKQVKPAPKKKPGRKPAAKKAK